VANNVQVLTDANWDADVLKSNVPVLVDFWADWCVPCKTLLPTIEAISAQYAGRLKVGKMNAEENPDVTFKYNVTTLPTLLVLKNGQVAEQRVGLVSKDKLVQLLEPLLQG
jgi:thioredoxin 1